MRATVWVGLALAVVVATAVRAVVPASAADARPNADEACVMKCDRESDQCMARAGRDEEKAKACDDKYAECLQKCR